MTRSADDEARGLEMLADAGAAIVSGVQRTAVGWVVVSVARLVDAWGLTGADRERAVAAAEAAGTQARDRVVGALRDLFALDPARQRATPLEVVRSIVAEPTEVLRAAGVPEVVRDPHEARLFPDDVYGLTPRDLAELGDADLAPQLLVWGMGKTLVLRARAARGVSDQEG